MAVRLKTKAYAFARKSVSKSQLPAETIDCPFFGMPNTESDHFVAFRSRTTDRLLKKLNERKATGHDMISAAILKKLHDCLAVPFTRVVTRLFFEGCWPRVWQYHIIVPIFKRNQHSCRVIIRECISLLFCPSLLSAWLVCFWSLILRALLTAIIHGLLQKASAVGFWSLCLCCLGF